MDKNYEAKLKNDSHELLNLLLQCGNRFVSKEEICVCLPQIFAGKFYTESHDLCSYIWTCKNYINNNFDEFNYIVITNKKGELKIPTESEAKEFVKHEFEVKCKQIKRVWKKIRALKQIDQTYFEEITGKQFGEVVLK